jgi:molybdate transport system permease protein
MTPSPSAANAAETVRSDRREMPARPLGLPGKLVLSLAAGLALAFLAVPVLALVGRGIEGRVWAVTPGDLGVGQAVALSLLTSALTAALTVLLGTPLAYVFARWQFPLRRALIVLVELPIVLPPVVAGLALLLTTGRNGLFGPALERLGIQVPFTLLAVVVAQTFVAAPFYIRSAQIGFQNVPREIEDAARVDGASGFVLFRRVTLPLTWSALASGLTLSWARALGEFGATVLLAGSLAGRTQTMPLLIYNVLEREHGLEAAIWTSMILLGLAVVALLVSQWLGQQSRAQSALREM